MNNTFRNIPQVEKLLQDERISLFFPLLGRGIVVDIVRNEISAFRTKLEAGEETGTDELTASIICSCSVKKLLKLQRVINGTGVALHTNLGRAPISRELLDKLGESLSGYCNLELHLPTGKRGRRGGYAEELICALTGAEDALIVNNNASSVFLILNEFAKDREVIISRGELVQIGGGFRIPDIMHQTGAKLVEVGTTNITELEDYSRAVTSDTAMILSVHRSNFNIEGFTEGPSLKDLSSLKNESILFVRDLGSGNLTGSANSEPAISYELSQGTDLLCFSGDKMLGACQSGIIIGRKDLIKRLKKNPLMRMLRVDKITYFLLQETLILHMNNETGKISLWEIIMQDKKAIESKISRLIKKIKSDNKKKFLSKIPVQSVFGGGALPHLNIESMGLQIKIPGRKAEDMYNEFITGNPPVAGYILNDVFTLDFRTIFDRDIPSVAEAIERIIKSAS